MGRLDSNHVKTQGSLYTLVASSFPVGFTDYERWGPKTGCPLASFGLPFNTNPQTGTLQHRHRLGQTGSPRRAFPRAFGHDSGTCPTRETIFWVRPLGPTGANRNPKPPRMSKKTTSPPQPRAVGNGIHFCDTRASQRLTPLYKEEMDSLVIVSQWLEKPRVIPHPQPPNLPRAPSVSRCSALRPRVQLGLGSGVHASKGPRAVGFRGVFVGSSSGLVHVLAIGFPWLFRSFRMGAPDDSHGFPQVSVVLQKSEELTNVSVCMITNGMFSHFGNQDRKRSGTFGCVGSSACHGLQRKDQTKLTYQ